MSLDGRHLSHRVAAEYGTGGRFGWQSALFELRRSIQQEGILVPLLVRKNPDGEGFEIIAGHRRKEAALWAGIKEVPAIICTMDDDQAVIAMIDSNLQREKILPSEKAFAYKMRLQAMNRQGKRKELSSAPLEPKCIEEMVEISLFEADVSENGKVNIKKTNSAGGYRSNEQLARMVGESVTQIKRYIRLTKLIPKILDMVDRELLAIRSAVEISFLTEEEQYELHRKECETIWRSIRQLISGQIPMGQ